MEKLITNLQQTYCTRNSYYMMSIINQFREKAPDLCINYLFGCGGALGNHLQPLHSHGEGPIVASIRRFVAKIFGRKIRCSA